MKQQQEVALHDSGEVLLDPLGWPLQQAGFETKTTAIFTDPLPAATAAVNPASSFESTDDGDDLDLIQYRPSDYCPGDDEDKKITMTVTMMHCEKKWGLKLCATTSILL
jgi:hypothetical protein